MCCSWEPGAVPIARNQRCCTQAPLLTKMVQEAATPAAETTPVQDSEPVRCEDRDTTTGQERNQANCRYTTQLWFRDCGRPDGCSWEPSTAGKPCGSCSGNALQLTVSKVSLQVKKHSWQISQNNNNLKMNCTKWNLNKKAMQKKSLKNRIVIHLKKENCERKTQSKQ